MVLVKGVVQLEPLWTLMENALVDSVSYHQLAVYQAACLEPMLLPTGNANLVLIHVQLALFLQQLVLHAQLDLPTLAAREDV